MGQNTDDLQGAALKKLDNVALAIKMYLFLFNLCLKYNPGLKIYDNIFH